MKKKILSVVLALCLVIGVICGFSLTSATANDAYENLSLESVGITQESVDASLMSMGDSSRMAKVMQRAAAGETITIGFIGGSITYGSGVRDKGYTVNERFSDLTLAWFEDRFPTATFELVNCALPETGSLIGNFRYESDLLQYEPDVIVIEFAVNDGAAYSTRETYEALLRKALAMENDPAVMMLMMCTGSGWNSQDNQAVLGTYYNLPMVSFKNGIDKAVALGATRKDFDADGTHPNVKGHAATALYIINWLEAVYADYESIDTTVDPMPDPLVSEDLKYVNTLTSANFTPTTLGSFAVANDCSIYAPFKNGWSVKNGGTEAFSFEVEAKRVYLPILLGPDHDGTILVTVNGVPAGIYGGYHSYKKQSSPLIFESETTEKVQVGVQLISGNQYVLSGIWTAY